jgi:death-on-curing protein
VTIYPTADDVFSIHRTLIERFGGSHGVRDLGGLESALARPRSGYYRDLIEEAAALWESLSQNHPFIDGNKRVAVTVTAAFLRVNGYWLEFTDTDAYSFLMGLYETGRMRFDSLDAWLRQHAVPESIK